MGFLKEKIMSKDLIEEYITLAGITKEQNKKLNEIGYYSAPASKGHHLSQKGGLVIHCANVTKRLLQLTETLGVEWPRLESPYLVGMFHDLVKCRCYEEDGIRASDGKDTWKYTQPLYPGHGTCSVAIANELGIILTPEEIAAITYHMGLYGVGKEYSDKEFDNAIRTMGSHILAIIYADWYAARIDEELKA